MMMIFPVFCNMVISHHIEFLTAKFYLKRGSGRLSRITVPNVVKIGPYIVEIVQFLDFAKWLSSHLEFLNS